MKFPKFELFKIAKGNARIASLKTLAIFFIFGSLIPILLISSISYFSARSILQAKAIERLDAISDSKLGQLNLFLDKIKIRTSDWSSDGKIRKLTEDIVSGKCRAFPKIEKCPAVADLSSHLKDKKLPLDPAILTADILDGNGFIIASSDKNRIGQNEAKEGYSDFEKAKTMRFGEALFANKLLLEDALLKNPAIHAFSPLFSLESEQFTGVLLIHISSGELNRIFEITSGETIESYLVNPEKLMITPSRFVPESVLKQHVDTAPTKNCFSNRNDFKGSYLNYRGKEALGVSRCIPDKFGVLVSEVETSEAFLSINIFRNITLLSLAIILALAILFSFFAGKRLLLPSAAVPTVVTVPIIATIAAIIIAAGVGISLFFTDAINQFAFQLKADSTISRINNAVKEYKINTLAVFDDWQKAENQKLISDFGGILNTVDIGRINVFNRSGVLIWTTQPYLVAVGSKIEADKMAPALEGKIVVNKGDSEKASGLSLNLKDFLEIYVPVFDESKNIVGVIEFYSNTSDLVALIGRLRIFIFASVFAAIFLITVFLSFVFKKQNEKIIRQAKELSSIIEKSPHGIFTIDKNGIINSFNLKIAEILGIRDRNEMIGKNAFDFFIFKNAGLNDFFERGLKKGESFCAEARHQIGGWQQNREENVYCYYSGVPILSFDNKEIEYLLVMVEDITERKKLELEIVEYTKGLEKKIGERTADLQAQTAELEKMNKLMVGREIKMAELKKEINNLKEKLEKIK